MDLPKLLTQLVGLERRTARGGRDTIDHGPGAHDDVVNVVAGAIDLAMSSKPQFGGWYVDGCLIDTEGNREKIWGGDDYFSHIEARGLRD